MGEIVSRLYPHDRMYEEVVLPDGLVLDLLVPTMRLVIECQGRQHDEFVPFFHGSRSGFHRAQDRDTRKRRWCELNGLHLIEVPHDATEDRVIEMIRGG